MRSDDLPDERLPNVLHLLAAAEHDDLAHGEVPEALERYVVAVLEAVAVGRVR